MILRASAAFIKRFQCAVTAVGPRRGHEYRIEEWSCHFVRLGNAPIVVAMHDATLYILVIPVTGVKTFGEFFRLFLTRVEQTWRKYEAEFDAENQSVIVLPRTDRSRIGSMNDAIMSIRWHVENDSALEGQEARANQTPYKAIDYHFPDELLERMLD